MILLDDVYSTADGVTDSFFVMVQQVSTIQKKFCHPSPRRHHHRANTTTLGWWGVLAGDGQSETVRKIILIPMYNFSISKIEFQISPYVSTLDSACEDIHVPTSNQNDAPVGRTTDVRARS